MGAGRGVPRQSQALAPPALQPQGPGEERPSEPPLPGAGGEEAGVTFSSKGLVSLQGARGDSGM